jgi:hypothetical protein
MVDQAFKSDARIHGPHPKEAQARCDLNESEYFGFQPIG